MENENQNQYIIRLILISALSVLFLYVWNTFISPPVVVDRPHLTTTISSNATTQSSFQDSSFFNAGDSLESNQRTIDADTPQHLENKKEEFYTLSNDNVKIVFSTKNAVISESYIYFNNGLVSKNLEEGNLEGLETGNLIFDDLLKRNINYSRLFYQILKQTDDSIVFYYADKDKNIIIQKTYTLIDSQLDLAIDIKRKGDNQMTVSLLNGSYMGKVDLKGEENSAFNRIQAGYNKGVKYKKVFGFDLFGFLKSDQDNFFFEGDRSYDWIGIDDRFFGRILKDNNRNSKAVFQKIKHDKVDHYLHGYSALLPEELQAKYSFYFLPKSRGLIDNYYQEKGEYFFNLFHQIRINRVLSNVMYKILQWIFKYLKDYGWSVILMTILIKLAVFPLTQKSMKSMQKMSDLAPKLENLRKNHKKNPKQLNIETLALYKKHNVNPIMGCLPILLTIPIFIALYSLFQSMVELKGVSFYWIEDLALPDVIATLGFHIPLMGNQLRLLPILMVVTAFLQSIYTPSPAASSSAGGVDDNKKNQQRQIAVMMKYYMPIMLFFISWNMPSALVLYWTCQNIFSLLQTFLLKISKNK